MKLFTSLAVASIALYGGSSSFAFTCNQEIAIVCTEGYIDGCSVPDDETENGSLTTHHVCVRANASAAERTGPSCLQEVALVCSIKGEIDACLLRPAVAEKHFCVKH